MKKQILTISVLVLFLGLFSVSTGAQTHKYLVINGIMCPEINSADSCLILISKNNGNPISSPVAYHGRFRLELEYNSTYELTFCKKGHQPKRIVFNTNIPDRSLIETANIPHFLMSVKLYARKQNLDFEENQIQHVTYFKQTNTFRKVLPAADYELVQKDNYQQTSLMPQALKLKSQNYQVF